MPPNPPSRSTWEHFIEADVWNALYHCDRLIQQLIRVWERERETAQVLNYLNVVLAPLTSYVLASQQLHFPLIIIPLLKSSPRACTKQFRWGLPVVAYRGPDHHRDFTTCHSSEQKQLDSCHVHRACALSGGVLTPDIAALWFLGCGDLDGIFLLNHPVLPYMISDSGTRSLMWTPQDWLSGLSKIQ